MKKSKLASRLAGGGGVLALALGLSMTTSQVAAVPYASQIRFSETQINQFLGTDLLYTLNEDADAVTVEVYNATDDVVVRTFNFTSPDPETTRGRHAVSWDNRDDSNNLLPLSADQLTIRVRVQKSDDSTDWTYITGNSSNATTKATQQKSVFNGFSSNDLAIPVDPTADQFGLIFAAHSYNAATPAGLVMFGADLAPALGNGGGAANVRGQHPAATPGSFALWKLGFDPLDPDLLWFGGQTAPSKAGFTNIGATNPADNDLALTESWNTGLFPRGFAVGLNSSDQRVAYIAMGNALYSASVDASSPFTLSGEQILTAGTLDGSTTRYAQAVDVDAEGNVYYLTRSSAAAPGFGRLFRWDLATVEAAPGTLLDETNAAWHVRVPAGTDFLNALHVDRANGNVYIAAANGNPRGIFFVGNASEATLASKPLDLTADDLVVDYNTDVPPGFATAGSQLGHGVAADWQGNLYITARTQEEIHSFSPPGRASEEDPAAEYDITTESPTGYSATVAFDKSNLVFVDQDGTPDGVVNFTSLRDAILSFGPGGQNNGFAGTNRIEVRSFGPFDEELPDLTGALDADDFEIVTTNGPALVLQRGSTWELGKNVSIDGLIIAASSTSTPATTLLSASAGTVTIDNVWIGALPADANTYTAVGDIPADLVDGSRAFDVGLVRAGEGLNISGATVSGTNVTITQSTDGVDLGSGSVDLTNATISSNSGPGIVASAPVTLNNADVVNNAGAGITSNSGAVTVTGGSLIGDNGLSGIVISSSASLSMDATFANPNQVLNNGGHGIAYSSGQQYQIRNTLIHGNDVGLDIQPGGYDSPLFNYDMSDVIISGNTTAGIRTASAQMISAARITLFDNNSGILDQATRTNLWSIELQDAIIAGAGDIGINSPGAGDATILLDHASLVTAGPDALATAINAPAGALDVGSFGQPAPINSNPAFRSTTYSSNRSGPDFFMAPTSLDYVGAAKPNDDAYAGGSPFQNLGGGSRWTLGPGLNTITVGTSGTQLYTTLADACDAVNSLGTTGSEVLTILIETDLVETRVSRLGIEAADGGVIIRPANGADVTVSWETAPALSSAVYSGQLAIGANQGTSNNVVDSENIVIDGRPDGSPAGTQLTFQGPGRHINLTGGAKGTIVRNTNFISTASSGAVLRTNPVRLGDVEHHPDNAVIENNFVNTASATGSHVAIEFSFQVTGLTRPTTGVQVRNNRIEYNSSALFIRTAHDLTITGNEIYGKAPEGGFDARGIMYIIGENTTTPHTDYIYNNVMDLVSPTTASTIGVVPIYLEPTGTGMITFNIYNNMISGQLTGPGGLVGGLPTSNKYHAIQATAGTNHNLNALHNSIHLKLASTAPFTGMVTANTGAIAWRPSGGSGKANVRNNLIRIEEPTAAAFVFHADKLADIKEDYNTVYRVPVEVGEPPVEMTPNYGHILGAATTYASLAEWQAGTGLGANSDEAVIEIAPETNPVEGFDGVWASASDRTTDPNNPVLPDLRWTAVPGDSSVWAGVPGLLTNLPGGNTDIDGTTRSSEKTYRGAHEGALMPGDAIPPDDDPPPGMLGDITGDEVVNVADVTALADALANGDEGEISLVVGDIDGDEDIDADDLEALVDMIVNP